MDLQTRVAPPAQQRRIFYGWWMVAAGLAMSLVNGALYAYGFSAYVRPLTQEFGWTRTEISGVISLSRLEGGVLSPVAGFFIDRFGPRRMMLLGVSLVAAGFMALSGAQDFLSFALVYIFILSLGSSFGTIAPIQTALANWFIRKRSFVLGLLFAGIAMGGLLVPVVNLIIEQHTWRGAALVSGFVFLGVGVASALAMRHRPEDHGYLPDGDQPNDAGSAGAGPGGAGQQAERPEVNFTPGDALRTRAFWLIAFAFMLWSMLPSIITVHMIIYFTDVGFEPQLAANIFAVYAVTSAVFRVVVGWAGDRVNKRFLLTGAWVVQVIGLFFLANVHTVLDVVPFILVFAPAYGGTVPLRGALQGEYFGRKYFGTISGLIRVVDLAGNVAGPVAVGWAFDNAGGVEGYRLAFRAIAVLNLLGALAILAAAPPALRRQEAGAAEGRH
ncbi:MAG: MFS transporter [Chloroflexi bacterium]|nr:MFS transporter [Chloroflexota bacterium]